MAFSFNKDILVKLVAQKGVAPSRITDFKSGHSAISGYPLSHLVASEGIAPSRITAFEAGRSAISGYPQGHLKLVQAMGLEPT